MRCAASRKLRRARNSAFTLIELLVVVAVVSILLLMGAPPMHNLIAGAQLRSEAARLQLAVNLARSEAVARNAPVSLCPSSYSRSGQLRCSGDYAGGWLVFSNPGRDSQLDAASDKLIRAFEPMPAGYWLSNRAGTNHVTTALTYYPDGATRRNLTLMVCAGRSTAVDSWSVVINQVGRARLARRWGDCPAQV